MDGCTKINQSINVMSYFNIIEYKAYIESHWLVWIYCNWIFWFNAFQSKLWGLSLAQVSTCHFPLKKRKRKRKKRKKKKGVTSHFGDSQGRKLRLNFLSCITWIMVPLFWTSYYGFFHILICFFFFRLEVKGGIRNFCLGVWD